MLVRIRYDFFNIYFVFLQVHLFCPQQMTQNMFQEGLYQVFFKDTPSTDPQIQTTNHVELVNGRIHRWFGTVVNTRLLVSGVVQIISSLACILTTITHACVSYNCSVSMTTPVWSSLFIITLMGLNIFSLLFGFSALLANSLRSTEPAALSTNQQCPSVHTGKRLIKELVHFSWEYYKKLIHFYGPQKIWCIRSYRGKGGVFTSGSEFIWAWKWVFKLVAQIQQVSSDWVAVHWTSYCEVGGPNMKYEQILEWYMLVLLS
ncbi:hypothetical protein L3Q82_023992 [Scortum barcoo]|uniref:Uncharacterized protein n=1 Tax=Scortum barcoo TaxID=214431 RepID=A0ACB8WUF4_9TELE|nr:hypothetical protein L3Q82_023992 [Scortum barcoo]